MNLNTRFGRAVLFGGLTLGLFGCSHTDDSFIVGTWSGAAGDVTMTLEAHKDTSFTLTALKPIKGRWELEGTDLKLFRDVSGGGDTSFGSDGDGAYHFTVSADHKTLTGMPVNNLQTVLTKH